MNGSFFHESGGCTRFEEEMHSKVWYKYRNRVVKRSAFIIHSALLSHFVKSALRLITALSSSLGTTQWYLTNVLVNAKELAIRNAFVRMRFSKLCRDLVNGNYTEMATKTYTKHNALGDGKHLYFLHGGCMGCSKLFSKFFEQHLKRKGVMSRNMDMMCRYQKTKRRIWETYSDNHQYFRSSSEMSH